MAPALPNLPAELLLKIIDCEESLNEQKHLFTTLRATCREINAKVVYFFGSKYFRKVRVKLNEAGILRLQAISKGPFSCHVHGISIDVGTLFEQIICGHESDTTDASQCSWYSESAMGDLDIGNCKCSFNESVANFITDGSCSQVLSPALLEFHNLKSFSIIPPIVVGRMVEEKMEGIESRWLMASKTVLAAVFTGAVALEQFSIEQTFDSLPMPLSALEMAAIHWPKWSDSLRKLQLDLVNDLKEDVSEPALKTKS